MKTLINIILTVAITFGLVGCNDEDARLAEIEKMSKTELNLNYSKSVFNENWDVEIFEKVVDKKTATIMQNQFINAVLVLKQNLELVEKKEDYRAYKKMKKIYNNLIIDKRATENFKFARDIYLPRAKMILTKNGDL